MCGIAGAFHYQSRQPVREAVLKDMARVMVHRGPDDEGYYQSANGSLGLSFRRLSIIDLSGGHQPMTTGDGRYTIIFNGEIYNHIDLRADLEARGIRFQTRADTEAILYAYQEYGADCLTRLQGMFAVAIWDEVEQSLFLARDRVGIKPLYFADMSDGMAFASEIKCLFEHPKLTPKLNRDEMARYLTFLCVPPPNTLFRGVQKLRGGHYMMVTQEGCSEPVRYWSPLPSAGQEEKSDEDWAEELLATLESSVTARLMSDVPFGAFLSGGVDSSSIVAVMAKYMSRPVETFSVGYKNDPGFNEFVHARETAKSFGCNHHEVLIDHNDFQRFLPRLVHHQDEPIADPVCVPPLLCG